MKHNISKLLDASVAATMQCPDILYLCKSVYFDATSAGTWAISDRLQQARVATEKLLAAIVAAEELSAQAPVSVPEAQPEQVPA
ncbi:hypothetical protein [Bradyrhizobium sp. URHD0069]|uniref:hypothetical protein n=1 Tax=Bradyrhizobium sp. URHD0069 TaxID=1380355 RepID=UPI0004954202|nr:hypothetical protein [Bradyrhizobium sp. URHD0069]